MLLHAGIQPTSRCIMASPAEAPCIKSLRAGRYEINLVSMFTSLNLQVHIQDTNYLDYNIVSIRVTFPHSHGVYSIARASVDKPLSVPPRDAKYPVLQA